MKKNVRREKTNKKVTKEETKQKPFQLADEIIRPPHISSNPKSNLCNFIILFVLVLKYIVLPNIKT